MICHNYVLTFTWTFANHICSDSHSQHTNIFYPSWQCGMICLIFFLILFLQFSSIFLAFKISYIKVCWFPYTHKGFTVGSESQIWNHEWRPQMGTTNGSHEWRPRMGTTNGSHKWRPRMETTNGNHGWEPRMEIIRMPTHACPMMW